MFSQKKAFYRKILRNIFLLAITFLTLSLSQAGDIYVAKLDDVTINPATSSYFKKCIDKAVKNKAECIIFEMDTPGGLITSTREIVKNIVNSEIPVIVYVSPSGSRAGSAGVFITLSSHVAVMAPITNIGAAHPVYSGQPDKEDDDKDKKESDDSLTEMLKRFLSKDEPTTGTLTKNKTKSKNVMDEKILNDTVAWVKTIANERGRNVDWAIDAVVNSSSITEKEAVEKNVVDFIAKDIGELVEKADGREVKLKSGEVKLSLKGKKLNNLPFTFTDKVLNIISHPNVAYILMLLGFLGLLFEVTHPGAAVPAVIGSICIILALFAMHVLPLNFAGILLIVLAIVFFIVEVKVVSYGLLSIAGIFCFVLGSMMLFDSPTAELRVSKTLIFTAAIVFCGIFIFLVTLVVRVRKNKPLTGQSGIIGEIGETMTELNPAGKVFVHSEIWSAESDSGMAIPAKTKVEVVSITGLKIKVKPYIKE